VDEITQTVGFRATPQEIASIDARAKAAGMSRADFARSKVVAAEEAPPQANVEALLRHLIYMASRIHIALYAIPQMAGTLSTKALKEIYEGTRSESVKYLAELSDVLAATQAKIAEQANSTTVAANGTVPAANGAQMRRCGDPVHARLFGEDECFICHVPIEARH